MSAAEPVMFHGRDIQTMSRDELLEILFELAPQISALQKLADELLADLQVLPGGKTLRN